MPGNERLIWKGDSVLGMTIRWRPHVTRTSLPSIRLLASHVSLKATNDGEKDGGRRSGPRNSHLPSLHYAHLVGGLCYRRQSQQDGQSEGKGKVSHVEAVIRNNVSKDE